MKYAQILLTGATGALGPALVAELARARAAERLVVLMRATPGELPERFGRWRESVKSLLGPDEQGCVERVRAVSGDICREDLGLDLAHAALQGETDVVIHAAADTNFAAPAERLQAVNVEGTRRICHWSEACPRLRRVLLVSSVFVSGSRTGVIEETATREAPEFVTHYQRTKWEAEQLVLGRGLPVGVARISMVLGSHATGAVHRPGAIHSLIKWFARGLVPMMPGLPEARGDVIATELAAGCVTRAVQAEWEADADGKAPIWHIAAGEAPRMSELIDFTYEHFAQRPKWRRRNIPRPVLVEQGEFNRYIATVEAAGHEVVAQAMRSVNRFLPDLLYPKTYATRRAEALWGGGRPPRYDWRETLGRVIGNLCPVDR